MAKFKCNICGQTFEADKMPDKCPSCQADNSNIEEIKEAVAPAAPKKKGIDTNSNIYTLVYAAVMVIIVAFLLAFVASSLKDKQEANVARDTKGQILQSLNIDINAQPVDETYAKVIKDELFKDGQLADYTGAFNTSYGTELKNGNLHVFVATLDNGETKYVIPVTGRGLWGGLWGYLALNDDLKTVYGAYFSHESETAGLGALIKEKPFQTRFQGKQIFKDGQIALTVVKNGSVKDPDTEVDGVTGATLTSKGVAAMVNDGLKLYDAFLATATEAAAAAEVEATEAAIDSLIQEAEPVEAPAESK